jgi:hypothetical protein
MTLHTVHLEKKDSNVQKAGLNINIICDDGYTINLTRDAMEELVKDYKKIKEEEKK